MYDYLENIKEDIIQYVKDEKEYLEGKDEEELIELLENEDSITGNMSGSYTFSTCEAEENLQGNLELLQGALMCLGYEDLSAVEIIDKGAEWCDVIIRYSLVRDAFEEVKDEVMEILESEEV